MRDEIPMHDSVHWPVEDEDKVKQPLRRRYLVTAVVETSVFFETRARTEAEAIDNFLKHAQTPEGATVSAHHFLSLKGSAAIALS